MCISRRNFLIGATALPGFASGAATAADKVTLRITAASSDLNEMWRALMAAFMEAYPHVDIEFDNSTRSYDDLVQSTLRASLTDALPDVSFQGANRIRTYIDRGLAVPLEEFLVADSSPSRRKISSSVETIGKFAGKTYALGFGVAVPLIFLNLDLTARAGVDMENLPTDWDGLIAVADRIRSLGDGTQGAYFQYDSADWLWMCLVESQGGHILSDDERKILFDGPEGLNALRILRKFGEAGQAGFDMTRDQARQMFAAGSMGMLVDSVSNLTAFQKASDGKFKLGTRKFPISAGNGRIPAAGSVGMMFASNPERRKLAWEFLKFASGFPGQRIVGTRSGWLPANADAIRNDPALRSHYIANPLAGPALGEIPALTIWYAFPGKNGVKITKSIVEHMRTVVTLKASPEQALAAMSQEVAGLLPD